MRADKHAGAFVSQPPAESIDDRLISIVDCRLRIVLAEPRLSELLANERLVAGASLADLLDETSLRALRLVAARVAEEVVLACPGDPARSIVARLAIARDATWITLHERACVLPRARAPNIVGRRTELLELERYLVSDELSILYVRGPLGIGKTALLGAFAARLDELGCPYLSLDATAIEPTSEAITAAMLGASSSVSSMTSLLTAARRLGSRRWVILVDNFDAWQDVAQTLADRPFRRLPVECRIVVAARRMPDSRWWDVAARTSRVMSLGVLPPDEASELQTRAGIAAEHADAVAVRAKGYPLCIVTLADAVRSGLSPTHVNVPVGLDFARLGGRRLLETAAIPARITEDVLAAILEEGDDVTGAYDRLAAVAVPDPSGIGLRMPDVLRESLRAGLRERSPLLFAAMQRRLLEHYGEVLDRRDVMHLYRAVDDFLDSFDDHPMIRELAGGREEESAVRTATMEDRPAIFAAARKFIGDEAAVTVLRRFDRGHAITTLLEGPDRIDGILQYVTPTASALEHLARVSHDHELTVALEALRRHPLPGSDEHVIAVLGWMTPEVSRGRWDRVSRALFRHVLHVLLSVPAPVATVFVHPAIPVPLPTGALPGAAPMQIDGRSVLYRDVRGLTARRMLGVLASATTDRTPFVEGLASAETRITVDLVRNALADLAHPDRLVRTPLLALRVVANEAGPGASPGDRAEALVRVLRRTIASLQGGPREQKQRRALEAVFVERSGKHETIAADLGLPYSTFRRYLARGLERVTDALRLHENSGR